MATLDWELDRTDGVTLVRLYVTADHPRRVRVENRLDGPVWPPRREGRPAAGWSDGAFEGRVTPDERLVIGYATPAPPDDGPPAEIVRDEPADATTTAVTASDRLVAADDHRVTAPDGGGALRRDAEAAPDVEQTPAGVIQSLGDPIVPRNAVPVPGAGDATDESTNGASSDDSDPAPDEDGRAASDGDRRGVGAEAVAADRPENAVPATDDSGPVATNGTGNVDAGGDDPLDDGHADEDYADGRDTDDSDIDDRADGRAADRAVDRPRAGLSTARVPVVPHAVRAWLRGVERRLDAVERRGAAAVDRDETLGVAVTADSRALARVARRVDTLTERAERLQAERRRTAPRAPDRRAQARREHERPEQRRPPDDGRPRDGSDGGR